MERMTYRLEDQYGNYICTGTPKKLEVALSRLAAYEDTGLEPEEIQAIAGLASENCEKTADAIDKLLQDDAELKSYRELGPIDRLRELAQADREGLVHIIQGPDPGASVCGNCGNFIRNPGKRTGVCKVQSCYRDHRGKDEPWRGSFSPSQSRKACRKFVRAKAALRREQDE